MDHALRHGQRALTDGDRQQQFSDGVHGDPHPMRGTGQPLYRVGRCDLPGFDGAEQRKQLIQLNLSDMDVVQKMARKRWRGSAASTSHPSTVFGSTSKTRATARMPSPSAKAPTAHTTSSGATRVPCKGVPWVSRT